MTLGYWQYQKRKSLHQETVSDPFGFYMTMVFISEKNQMSQQVEIE